MNEEEKVKCVKEVLRYTKESQAYAMRKTVYLTGKVGGDKWQIVKAIPSVKFEASDGSNHSEHLWGGGYYNFGDEVLVDQVSSDCLSLITACDCLVAYVDSPDSFGSIAEIAWASAINKDCWLLIKVDKLLSSGDSFTESYLDMYDAYWFVSCLPNVIPIPVENINAAVIWAKLLLSTQSPMEALLHKGLLRDSRSQINALFIPVPQYRVDAYRLDFAFPAKRVAIEVDGHEYHSSKEQRGHDAQRDRFLTAAGWTVLRFTGSEIHNNVNRCVNEVYSLLEAKEENASLIKV